MFKCTTCTKPHSSTKRTLCKPCHDAANPGRQSLGRAHNSSLPVLNNEDTANLPDLPPDWVTQPVQNLNGGHILKILLMGNNAINQKIDELSDRIDLLETDLGVKDATITKQDESITANEGKITALEEQIVTLKKTIVNQQKFMEQMQRNNLAKNIMITGVPDTALVIAGAEYNTPEEKIHAIIKELNPAVSPNNYKIKMFDPFTAINGTVTHCAKVIMDTVELKQTTITNAKTFKEHENEIFHSIYVKNDETKLARDENYRLRQKARAIRTLHPNEPVKIEKGVLKHNGNDQFDLSNQIFQ